jgi:hypothetical protein
VRQVQQYSDAVMKPAAAAAAAAAAASLLEGHAGCH